MIDVRHRRATEDDLRFAEVTFRDSFRVQHWAGPLCPWDRSAWNAFAEPEIRRILRDGRVEVVVAYHPDMPADSLADIIGWMAWRPGGRGRAVHVMQGRSERRIETGREHLPLVIYTYVKKHFREQGIARGLFDVIGLDPWRHRYEYACRTSALMAWPSKDSTWDRPVIERMELAQWNPRATRGGRRHGQDDDEDGGRERVD